MPKQNMCTCFRGSNWSALCIYIYPVRLTSIIFINFPSQGCMKCDFSLASWRMQAPVEPNSKTCVRGPGPPGWLWSTSDERFPNPHLIDSSFPYLSIYVLVERYWAATKLPLLLISARNVRIKVLRNVCTNFCFPACRGWQHWLPTSGYQKALHTLQKDLPCDSITAICCARFSHCLRQNPLANWKVWAIWWLSMYRSSSDPSLRIHIGGPWSIEYLWIPWDPATGQGRAPPMVFICIHQLFLVLRSS
jgi:hypothetical protein